ncbi:MAG: transcriptional repressor, CopY family [Herbinix sp.]|nr:transcriptional repressor, CopY family [Herbinix sp.]
MKEIQLGALMKEIQLGAVEARFADIIWQNEPLTSGELVKLCAQELIWKKSTTYTILKKLCERGLFQNQDGIVSSLITKQEFYVLQGEKFVNEGFDGSLPAFLAAFTTRKKLSDAEIDELQQLINKNRR